jgi:predicted MFS family arabinose efflux permease
MRITSLRLAILICALGALSESLFYTALAPMLPQLDDQLGFQKEQAGLLVAGYAIGY